MSNTWSVILNPKASSGKCAKHWPQIKDLLEKHGLDFEVHRTEYPQHAIELAREAVKGGSRQLLAVGGDGTVNEVVNGLFTQDSVDTTEVVISQIPVGTGNDWGRTVGIPKSYEDAVKALKEGKTIVQDIGYVDFSDEGNKVRRYFANIGGMGFQAFVGIIANERKAEGKGGIMGYVNALVSSLIKYKALPARYYVDGVEKGDTDVFSVAVGICQYNGGGMKQCPDAIYDDGLLDLTMIHNLSKGKVLRNVPNLFTGKFIKNKEVFQFRGKEIRIESEDLLLEVDGENIGKGSAVFGIEAGRLKVRVGA